MIPHHAIEAGHPLGWPAVCPLMHGASAEVISRFGSTEKILRHKSGQHLQLSRGRSTAPKNHTFKCQRGAHGNERAAEYLQFCHA
jgi:hypothetical protein